VAIVEGGASWTRAIDGLIAPGTSVAVGAAGRIVYARAGRVDRPPASAQKLLTSMAALDLLGPARRLPTVAAAERSPDAGVVRGDLWLVGSGDPELGGGDLAALARHVAARGVRRVTGSVVGDTAALSRRWWAPGWVRGISRRYVTRPTALVYEGNRARLPELAAAASFASALRGAGVTVDGGADAAPAPTRLRTIAAVRSDPLARLLLRQNHGSLNLHAEILLRVVGDAVAGAGTSAAGAEVVERWAASRGVRIRVRDGSGLSHLDAASAIDLAWLLLEATREPWGDALLASLPPPGRGTLAGRLAGVPVRAKTGTLFTIPVSSLAGYVRDAEGRLVAFAVVSYGPSKAAATAIEDGVVRVLAGASVG